MGELMDLIAPIINVAIRTVLLKALPQIAPIPNPNKPAPKAEAD